MGVALLAISQVPLRATDISTSEFLVHCEAAPELCKFKIIAYVKFLVEGDMVDKCIMHLAVNDVAEKIIGWMRAHPEQGDKDWVDCLDAAIAALDLCGR
jgi:hypothetical protein